MTVVIDADERRELEIRLHGLMGADDVFAFYYDETNNPRRIHVTAQGFNVRAPQCFVLGGVAHRGAAKPFDLPGLRRAVKLQDNAQELKLKHLGKGDILQLLGRPRVEAYLDWLGAEGLLIHFLALDPAYWSLVDIVDALLGLEELAPVRRFRNKLKNDLYRVLAVDLDDLADLYLRFDYPNVGAERLAAFFRDLKARLEEREDLLDEFGFHMLKGVLDRGRHIEDLPLLRDEAPNIIIDGFADFFVSRLCLFKNAQHRLDVEEVVEAKLRGYRLVCRGGPLEHFSFVDSKAEAGVQASDPIVGLLGKLFSYAARAGRRQMMEDRLSLGEAQLRTLQKLSALLARSDAEMPALFQTVMAQDTSSAFWQFVDGP